MWIATTNDQLVSYKDSNMEEKVGPFSNNNKTQCPDEVGEYLVEKYPQFYDPSSEAEDEVEESDSEQFETDYGITES